MKLRQIIPAAAVAALLAAPLGAQQNADEAKPTPAPPPELTKVTGRIMLADDLNTTGGTIYFVFQGRIIELPHEEPEKAVRDKAEYVVKVDEGGSFSLDMAPGNYALFYDINESPTGPLEAGPDSMNKVQGLDRDRVRARIEAIKANAQKGLPIVDGTLGDSMFIIENRIVRPPATEFGEMLLADDNIVTLLAKKNDTEPVDFPAVLNIRGMNGDIYEPHNPTVTAPGQYVFYDVLPQFYQVIATATRPKPGEGDTATTPTLENSTFVFDGAPLLHEVTVIPGSAGE